MQLLESGPAFPTPPSILFAEKHPYRSLTRYAAVNEEPEVYREMLQGLHFKKALSICSGGEVLLFNILPVSDEVIGVDHSVMSIAAALTKILMLGTWGAKRTLEFLSRTEDYSDGRKVLQKKSEDICVFEEFFPPAIRQGMLDFAQRFHPTRPVSPAINAGDWNNIRLEWSRFTPEQCQDVADRLNRLSLVHGCITDMADQGPFDLIYASNAMDHTKRPPKGESYGATLKITELKPLLAPGGHLLFAGGYGTLPHQGFTTISAIRKGSRTGWNYGLEQLEA
jgi:hypothetical protein